jgi:hypothetical protein
MIKGVTIGRKIKKPMIIKILNMYILHFANPEKFLFCIPAHPIGFRGLKCISE